MRAAVQLENPIAEVLHPEAETGHTQGANAFELRLGERAGLAFERHLLRRVPGCAGRQSRDKALQLAGREKRGRAAAEVHEVQGATGDRRRLEIQLPLAPEEVQILFDVARVLVRVDAEIAEMALLPAERDVEVQPERHAPACGCCQRRPRVPPDGVRGPDRERRIVGNEVAADFRLIELGGARAVGHLPTIPTTGPICLPGPANVAGGIYCVPTSRIGIVGVAEPPAGSAVTAKPFGASDVPGSPVIRPRPSASRLRSPAFSGVPAAGRIQSW